MTTPAVPTTIPRRRIWSDPYFYVLLAVISATYILLILAMLLADATYLFTSDMRKDARVNFETYRGQDGEQLFQAGELLDSQYAGYGMSVEASDEASDDGRPAWPMILDSGDPPPGLEHLGTPHADFDGPGQGEGGGQQAAARQRNRIRQRNVVVISRRQDQLQLAESGRLVFTWTDPVRIDELTLLDVHAPGGVITTLNDEGRILRQVPIPVAGANGLIVLDMLPDTASAGEYTSRVTRLELELPNSGAVAELRFKWVGRSLTPWERRNPALARLLYNPMTLALRKPEIRYSIKLSLISCTLTAILSMWVAVPIGYLLSRHRFPGHNLLDAVLDIPIVLPPLVVGLSLLILFQFAPRWLHNAVVYQIPAVILAQFSVACAFAVRTMRATFDQIDARREQVALTLGCSRFQAFGMVVVPEAWRGMLTAGTLAWARSLGEFGPLLIFAGATRNKTEVLSTSVFLEMTVGDLGAAVAVSLIMVFGAVTVLVIARLWGNRNLAL